MPSRVEKLSNKATAVAFRGDAPIRASKIPGPLRFPLVVTLSLALSSLLHSFAAEYTARDLAAVSRSLDQWWQVGTLVGWRAFALGVGWYGNYDSYDLVSLSFLSQGPPLYLLSTFYGVRVSTVATSLAIDALTTYVPFRLLRPLSLAHAASTSSRSVVVPNREVVTDYSIQAITTLLVASIYSVTLYTAYASYLPIHLVTYFEGITSLTAAHSASPISLMPITLLLGLATKSFIFTPAVVAVPSLADAKGSAFNPATATLGQTFWHNIGGYNTRTKTVVKRTLTMMLVTGVNTFVQTFVTIDGVEMTGAAAYSGIFVVAGGISGIALGLVGAV